MQCIEWLEAVMAAWMPAAPAIEPVPSVRAGFWETEMDRLRRIVDGHWSVDPDMRPWGLFWQRGEAAYAVVGAVDDLTLLETGGAAVTHVAIVDEGFAAAWIDGVLDAWWMAADWCDAVAASGPVPYLHIYRAVPVDKAAVKALRLAGGGGCVGDVFRVFVHEEA